MKIIATSSLILKGLSPATPLKGLGIKINKPTLESVKRWEVQQGDDCHGPYHSEKEAMHLVRTLLGKGNYGAASLIELLEYTEFRYVEEKRNERKMTGIEYFLSNSQRFSKPIRL